MTDPASLGFSLVQERRDGSRQYGRRDHPYLSYWLLVRADGMAELSWEFALGDYLSSKGLSVSAQDALSLFLFPGREQVGPFDEGWVQGAVAEVEERLRSIDLASGT